MDSIESIKQYVTCKKCKKFMDHPIRLPCNTICSKHVIELKDKKGKCNLCSKTHKIPDEGFELDENVCEIIIKYSILNEEEKNLNGRIQKKLEEINGKIDDLKKNYDLISELLYAKTVDIELKNNFQNQLNNIGIELIKNNQINKCLMDKKSVEIENKKKFESNLNRSLEMLENSIQDTKDIKEMLFGDLELTKQESKAEQKKETKKESELIIYIYLKRKRNK